MVVAADPVLLEADPPGQVRVGGLGHEDPVDGDDLLSADLLGRGRLLDGESMASMLARISRVVVPMDRPTSDLASARARVRASTWRPSTLEEAIDSVRSRSRARGASPGAALAFRARTAASASEITPARAPERERSIPATGSGTNAS